MSQDPIFDRPIILSHQFDGATIVLDGHLRFRAALESGALKATPAKARCYLNIGEPGRLRYIEL
jgi:hypothetical protein